MDPLLYEKRDGVAYITFNRPEVHNAISPEVMVRLADAWVDFNEDPQARVAIITGAGTKAFSAGADLGRLIPLFTRARQPEDEWDRRVLENRGAVQSIALLRTYELFKPIIAAVNGFCLAGGMEMLQATDIRIASTNASFGLSEVKRAIIPAGGSLVRLARQIPYCKAMEILLVGDAISAEEAYRCGLVNYVVAPDELIPAAERLARAVAENGPLALQAIKEGVIRTTGIPLDDAFKLELELGRRVMKSEDAKEGPRAFMEKRKPRYTGR
jgi:enoyl-CoA hydratase